MRRYSSGYVEFPFSDHRSRKVRGISEKIQLTAVDGGRRRLYDSKCISMLDLRDVGRTGRRDRQRTTIQRLFRILRA